MQIFRDRCGIHAFVFFRRDLRGTLIDIFGQVLSINSLYVKAAWLHFLLLVPCSILQLYKAPNFYCWQNANRLVKQRGVHVA